MTITTRFAPSPTGYLHIGGARTALYSWLHAKASGGRFVLRIEDTDRERSTDEAVQAILDAMEWLDLEHDGEIYYQTKRFDRYAEVIDWLLAEGKAYRCYSTAEEVEAMREAARAKGEKPKYDGTWRPMPGKTLPEPPEGVDPVIRFATPLDGETVIHDLVKGDITISNTELDDLVIARADGTPTYNFCVVVDDMDMAISHIIRGDDHVNNTPRQINILKALIGDFAELPVYAHVPMILGPDGKRLSKRHGAVGVMRYREEGFLPEALLNYLVRLGWAHGDQEIFTREQMLEHFDIEHVQGGASTFDPDKLLWVNQEHLKMAAPEDLVGELRWHLARLGIEDVDDTRLAEIAAIQKGRCKTVLEMAEQTLFVFQPVTEYEPKAVKKHVKAATPDLLAQVRDGLAKLDEWTGEAASAVVKQVSADNEVGMGKVAQPIRIAVTGGPVSPSIDDTLVLLGRDETLARLDAAVAAFASEPG
ncbi:Glutamate--tRNA ligase protein [Salinisphaera shabanensis E1L3A]|uniref:Glutamate--tRNA ligase n=1 Tax=Salinisphaera shabanensis E1L3A TaxID=1033802 RepID=U2G1F4_9GAMM|nr:glutamate--tRNA ligase [Salinisphaera shabanensis]ERJ20048.1 Glutamate--tRNA ligase protein [Salinisphaera shabanensis E1L3A]